MVKALGEKRLLLEAEVQSGASDTSTLAPERTQSKSVCARGVRKLEISCVVS